MYRGKWCRVAHPMPRTTATGTRRCIMVRFVIVCGLAGCGLLLAPAWDGHAEEKKEKREFDRSKAGTVRKATLDTEEPEVEEISREKFSCNVDVLKIGNLKKASWYKLAESGYFELKRDSESPLLALRGKTVGWWCTKAGEDFQADTGAEYIVVQRGPAGAGNLVYYKKKK